MAGRRSAGPGWEASTSTKLTSLLCRARLTRSGDADLTTTVHGDLFRLGRRIGKLAGEEIVMSKQNAFADILDAAEQLDADAQAERAAPLARG